LSQLDGSCRTPIAALARIDGDTISFKGVILTPDGARIYETERKGGVKDAVALGKDAAHELFDRGGKDVFRNVA
ncbi:MAG: hydroxymethylbilane synthase, partial [Rhodomicrobium sp.]